MLVFLYKKIDRRRLGVPFEMNGSIRVGRGGPSYKTLRPGSRNSTLL